MNIEEWDKLPIFLSSAYFCRLQSNFFLNGMNFPSFCQVHIFVAYSSNFFLNRINFNEYLLKEV